MRTLTVALIALALSTGLIYDLASACAEGFDYHPYVRGAADYLLSHYNDALGMIYESELKESHPLGYPDQYYDNTYWIYSDNYLASRALRELAPSIAQNISRTIRELKEKHNLPESGLYEVLFGDRISTRLRASNSILVESSRDYYIFADIHNGSEIRDWYDYSDLLCYQALNFYWRGELETAKELWFKAYSMYDGKGLYDKATRNDGFYANYKLALLVYSAEIIKPDVDLEPLKRRLLDFQDKASGGIVSLSDLEGNPVGSCNAETTSLFILALHSSGNFGNRPSDLAVLITRYGGLIVGLVMAGSLVYFFYQLFRDFPRPNRSHL